MSYYGAIIIWVIAGIYALCMLCCCNRIALAIAIYKAAAEFITANFRVYSLPALSIFIFVIFLACWIVTALYVYSVGVVEAGNLSVLPNIVWDQTTRYVWLFHLFGLLWVMSFLISAVQFIIACMAATWYFTHQSESKGKASCCTGLAWLCKYHLGSIAFGSFIIAVCYAIQLAFEWYRKKFE